MTPEQRIAELEALVVELQRQAGICTAEVSVCAKQFRRYWQGRADAFIDAASFARNHTKRAALASTPPAAIPGAVQPGESQAVPIGMWNDPAWDRIAGVQPKTCSRCGRSGVIAVGWPGVLSRMPCPECAALASTPPAKEQP